MAPKTRIVTLDDLKNDEPNNDAATAVATSNFRDGDDRRSTARAAGYNNHYSTIPNAYCKPIGEGHAPPSTIPLCVIPNLERKDACQKLLHRIHDEFGPIIRRRGYNVTSISEMCCCGDGLDSQPGNKKCRKMGNNVWGYNQTTSFRRTSGRGTNTTTARSKTLHSIHLRLRKPNDHYQLHSWEDVAGTMAHELAHCEHQNHSQAFYKLMEEILDEHALLQAQKLSSSTSNHNPRALTPAESQLAKLSSDGGHRLGGASTTMGSSHLLGRKLGGQNPSSGQTYRELAARAAESRRKQLKQLRAMIERSREPCVIEIFDDEGNESDVVVALPPERGDGDAVTLVEERPRPTRKRRARNPQQGSNDSIYNNTIGRPSALAKQGDPSNIVIDLTAVADASSPGIHNITNRSRSRAKNKKKQKAAEQIHAVAIDLTTTTIPIGGVDWVCGLCTFQNRASPTLCEICHGPR